MRLPLSVRACVCVLRCGLEAVHFDLSVCETQTSLSVGQEVVNILTLITLELNDLAHNLVFHDCAIASKLLLDDLQDLGLVKLLWNSLDRGQSLATVAFCPSESVHVPKMTTTGDIHRTYAEFGYECSSETASWPRRHRHRLRQRGLIVIVSMAVRGRQSAE